VLDNLLNYTLTIAPRALLKALNHTKHKKRSRMELQLSFSMLIFPQS
jgi:hypothetical protein